MNIRPLGNRILAEPVRRATKAVDSPIIVPEAYRPDDLEFRVVAIGPGKLKKDGTREPIGLEVGWRVLSHAYSAKHLEIGDQKLRIIDFDDVLMVLPP